MKNIDETTIQKIPCLILTDLIVKLTSLSINLHNKSLWYVQDIKKTISKKRRLEVLAHP